ncbi:hypothetical protein [Paucibacter sp. DJ2R-2]|uniref:hypothetical protein n=1 Tax=Paucibacter sp. DJ2R-2 TaxID=2893558 RepID=UPI0021E3C6A5|nr:hypothetical protein [Paucibacter sp. DJ2R-2]MCV2419090.1 hypothetical protein [Paucibacter sp. DJ4R-1]MCV2437955.1 hypothetical protein [Paucibacter sp. DJ2R-2]
MIVDFDDTCWSQQDESWNRSLLEFLVLLVMHEQHAVRAEPDSMIAWCSVHLRMHVEYFKIRLASSQARANAIVLRVLPSGDSGATAPPPWALTATAAGALVKRPLRLVLENGNSDRAFVESTIPSFTQWCDREWIDPDHGGGSEMQKDISETAMNVAAQWRTFYLFDSDRLHHSELASGWTPPNGDGCQGYKFERSCEALPRSRWHMLRRRSIENYLPPSVLSSVNVTTATVLFSSEVGQMAHFYNFKRGLAGDGVMPSDPKKVVRAGRSQGFWSQLSPPAVAALSQGFGEKISEKFNNVPVNHPWPNDVLLEMDALMGALQDAI